MAILYGTQSNGETLPVLVDQFGNLLAKGIEGPPGPPGIGQLPPDPYEGAILGWENGELAWIGGSVPLPAGTYGPFIYDATGGTLTVPQDVSTLVNGQQLFMSDASGNPAIATFTTAFIQNVADSQSEVSGIEVGTPYSASLDWDAVFDRALNANGAVASSGDYKFVFTQTHDVSTIQFLSDYPMDGSIKVWDENNNSIAITTSNTTLEMFTENPYPNSYTSFDPQGATGGSWNKAIYEVPNGKVSAISVGSGLRLQGVVFDGVPLVNGITEKLLTFQTFSNFDKFAVGDVVQGTDVEITEIGVTEASMVVNGGDWYGADGTGSPGGAVRLAKEFEGSGSVLTGVNDTIILRTNNGEWIDDFYVTTPEQQIAVRKVAANARKLRKK